MSAGAAPGGRAEELCDITLSFWEVAVHTVLHARRVYPAAIFERRREYGIAVWMSRHPDLNDAIHEALYHARPHLLRGALEAAILVLLDGAGVAFEQYVFRVDLAAAREVPATYSDAETMLASAIVRLGALESVLPPVPRDATFTLLLQTHEVLTGPADKADYAASVAAAGGSTVATGWTAGALGVDSGSGGGASGSGGGTDGPFWIRGDAGDPELALAVASGKAQNTSSSSGGGGGAAALPATAMRPIKTIRAGTLALDVELHRFAAA